MLRQDFLSRKVALLFPEKCISTCQRLIDLRITPETDLTFVSIMQSPPRLFLGQITHGWHLKSFDKTITGTQRSLRAKIYSDLWSNTNSSVTVHCTVWSNTDLLLINTHDDHCKAALARTRRGGCGIPAGLVCSRDGLFPRVRPDQSAFRPSPCTPAGHLQRNASHGFGPCTQGRGDSTANSP